MNKNKKSSKGKSGYVIGFCSEIVASLLLIIKGYRISALRYKTFVGEIDIIAEKKNLTVFVEVKFRRKKENSLNAISEKNKNRVTKAANLYIAKHKDSGYLHNYRFDAITFYPPFCFKHIKNAWSDNNI